jgi:hypoxanthine phosphoribosyltransferase
MTGGKSYNSGWMDSKDKLHCLYPRSEIEAVVRRLASDVSGYYHEKNPLLIGILKGSFIFVRMLDFPLEVDFIRLASYGQSRQTSGRVEVVQGLLAQVTGRHVLVIEDIIDSGVTTTFLLDYLKKREPSSLRLCALMDKPSRRRVPVHIDYPGFTVPDKFLVGYGLDYDEKFRNLPDICYLENGEPG